MTALATLLRLIGLRRLRQAPAQSLRTTAAVMVAVGALISCWLVGAAVERGVAEGLEAFTGRTALRVTAGGTGLPEALLDTVRGVPGVDTAVPVIESPAYVAGSDGEVLTVLGLDLDAESRVRRYAGTGANDEVVDDPLVFLSQPSSIILTKHWAQRHRLARDDTLTLVTPQGRRDFVVRGLLEPTGPALAFGGALAIMDYQAAQVAFAKRRRVDEIDVVATAATNVEELATALRAALGPGVRVEVPGAFAAETVVAVRSLSSVLWLMSSFVAIVAMFLLYNAVAMTVARRGEEIALLRVLGVRRRDAVRALLVEAVVLGSIGALAGVPFGLGLARLMLRPTVTSVRTALVAPIDAAPLGPLGPTGLMAAVVLGLAISVLGAWRPAHQAGRFVPVVAARRGAVMALREARLPSPWWGALSLVLAVAAAGIAFATRASALGPLADLAFVLGFALLAPTVIRLAFPLLARLLRPLGVTGQLAILGLATRPQRSALTATPLMVAVALAVVVATMNRSFLVTFDDWFLSFGERTLQIASVSQDPGRAVLLPDAVAQAIARVPGIERMRRFRMMHTTYAGRRIVIEYNDYDPADPTHADLRIRRGDPATAFARLAAGDAVMVSENFALIFGIGPGDVLPVPTPSGVRELPVVATAVNFNGDQGSIMTAHRLFVDLFGDDRVQFVLATMQAGIDAETVRASIARGLGEEHQLVIFTLADMRQDLVERIDAAFLPASGLLALAIGIGCLGIAHALAIAVEERRREVGTLRALGTLRAGIVRLVVAEALALGSLGVLLGLVLGALLSYLWVAVHVRHILGWMLDWHFGGVGTVAGIVAALVVAPLAASWPARRAARIHPVEALASE